MAATDTARLFWPAAVVRALTPGRLLAVLVGLAITQVLLAVPLAVQEQPFQFWQPPWELIHKLAASGSGWTVLWGLILGIVVGVVWGQVGGWIAWLEFCEQKSAARTMRSESVRAISVLAFMERKSATLSGPVILVLLIVASLVVLGWLAGGVNYLLPWGIGATLLALLLPVLLLLGFIVVLCVIGCLALPIMPAATAAEGSDSFDALSRGFSYLYQRPLSYALWWGLALLLAALPLLAVLSLVQGEQPLLGAEARPVLLWIGTLVSVAIFWSLQPLVYVKMRWLIDEVGETELWTGEQPPSGDKGGNVGGMSSPTPQIASQETFRRQGDRETGRQGDRELASALLPVSLSPGLPVSLSTEVGDTDDLIAVRERIRFVETLTLGNAGAPSKLVALLSGLVWTALVLAAGLWAASRLVAGGVEWTPAALHQMVLEMAQQRPLALALIFLAVVVLASVGLGRPMRMITRMIAVRAVYEQEISLGGQALPFARRSGNQGLVAVLLLTAATVLFLASLPLAFLVWEEAGQRAGASLLAELACLYGAALVLGGIGALGLGAVAVDGRRLEEKGTSPLGIYVASGGEVLASALGAVLMGILRSATLFGLAALTWFFVSESLGWVGGESRWVRWGLTGRLVPEVEGPLPWFASRVAGLWFFLLFGLVLTYPLSYLLRWGVICYFALDSRPRNPSRNRSNWTMRNAGTCSKGRRSERKKPDAEAAAPRPPGYRPRSGLSRSAFPAKPQAADGSNSHPVDRWASNWSVIVAVLPSPPRSRVNPLPSARVRDTESSICRAMPRWPMWTSIMAALRSRAMGLASPFPAMSGALP